MADLSSIRQTLRSCMIARWSCMFSIGRSFSLEADLLRMRWMIQVAIQWARVASAGCLARMSSSRSLILGSRGLSPLKRTLTRLDS